MQSKTKEYVFILLLAIVSFIVYASSLHAPFIFDDNHMIVENVFIKSAKYFSEFFKGFVTSYPIPKGMCRPLLMLTFGFNYLQGGLSPVGYHIVNILFHFLNACLLYFLLKFLNKSVPRGLIFIITLLFVVHPLNTEAVTYISSRSDLMVTFFIISSFFLYLKGKYTLSCLMYVPALLTKETGLVLPILILGYYLLYQFKNIICTFKNKRVVFFFVSLFIVTLFYLYYKKLYFAPITPGSSRPIFSNILTQSWVTFSYLKLFLWPDNLNFLHSTPDLTSIFQIKANFAFMGIIALIIVMFILRKRKNLLSLGILLYLVGLLPKFYATLKVPFAEHHFYLPSIGIYILLLALLEKLYLKQRKNFLYPAIGVILALSALTWERNCQLNRPLWVWKIGVEKEPKHIGNWLNLGVAHKDNGNIEKAKEIFQKALSVFNEDKDWQAGLYVNLAGIHFLEEEHKEAFKLLDKALGLNPKIPRVCQIYSSMANIYEKENQEAQAIEYRKKALKLNPYAWEICQKLARAFIEKAKTPPLKVSGGPLRPVDNFIEAKKYIEKAEKINPHHFYSYFLLGVIYEKEGKLEKAATFYKTSIELKADWFYSHYYLCLIYIKLKNPLFINELEETIRLNPSFEPALSLSKFILK